MSPVRTGAESAHTSWATQNGEMEIASQSAFAMTVQPDKIHRSEIPENRTGVEAARTSWVTQNGEMEIASQSAY